MTNDSDVDSSANGETRTVSGVAAGVVGSASTNVGSAVTGAYGSITIAAGGAYTYTVDNSNAAVQALRTSGHTLQDVFSYTVTDAGGLTSTTQITITIEGANDAPVGMDDTNIAVEAGGVANGTAGINPTGNVLTNDTDVDAGDTKAVSALVAGIQNSASGGVGANVAGSFGTITMLADGSYSYAVDNSHSAVQALRLSSQSLTDYFTYQVSDSAGLTSLATLTITIQGANDTPHDIAATSLTVAENSANGSSVGSLTGMDVDAGTVYSYTLTDDAGGRFAIDPVTGLVTVADSSLLDYETSTSHTVTVRATDEGGLYVERTFTINLTDMNEFAATAPVDVDAVPNLVAENVATGSLVGITASASDADATNNAITYSLDDSAGGRFAIDPSSGVVTVADGSLLNYEAASTHTISIRSTSADGSFAVQAFTVSLTDVNEWAISQVVDTNSSQNFVNENVPVGTPTGVTMLATDADGTATVTYSWTMTQGGALASMPTLVWSPWRELSIEKLLTATTSRFVRLARTIRPQSNLSRSGLVIKMILILDQSLIRITRSIQLPRTPPREHPSAWWSWLKMAIPPTMQSVTLYWITQVAASPSMRLLVLYRSPMVAC